MRRVAALLLAIIAAVVGVIVWFTFLKYEKVDIRKEMSGAGITNIMLDLRDVDLIIQKSPNQQITARISGEKAKADHWILEAYIQDSSLRIESKFAQRAYLNYKDKPKRELIVSLPQKQYDDIRVNFSADWRNASLAVEAASGEIHAIPLKSLKDSNHIETMFGNMRVQN